MIQQEYKNNVKDVSGNIASTGFSIEINESMFQMLTSNVYNDPILAVIREWSTNACDACLAADKEVKFDVHIPTLEEPYFEVRDYGTGLAPEDIVGLFSNLGASTKRDSNKYNGTFGIGRMAGLAVSNAFTVESFYKGNHYQYAISMQSGIPVTLHLLNQPTDQPDGLKLSVAVESDEIRYYEDKAKRLYKFFDHKPILNVDHLNIELDVKEHISDNWFIQDSNVFDDSNYVVMSQVPYAIPYDSKVDNKGFKNLVIKVPPGSVSFNPGRESLSLNKDTVAYINKKFKEVEEEYVHNAIIALSKGQTDKEVLDIASTLQDAAPYEVGKKIISTSFLSGAYQAIITQSYYARAGNYNVLPSENITTYMSNLAECHYKPKHRIHGKRLANNSYDTMSYKHFFSISHVIIDVKTNFKKQLASNFTDKSVMYWQKVPGEDIDQAVAKCKEVLGELSINYELASDILVNFETSSTSTVQREGVYASDIVLRAYHVCGSQKISAEDTTENQYLYVPLKNTTPDIENFGYSFEELCDMYVKLGTLVPDLPKLKGVPKKYLDQVKALDNWVPLQDYINDKLPKLILKKPISIDLPRFNSSVINLSILDKYPTLIQNYYREVQRYKSFITCDTTVIDTRMIDVYTKLGATFIEYEPKVEVDLDELETIFPETTKLIVTKSYYEPITESLALRLAKLEEYYAVHSTNG